MVTSAIDTMPANARLWVYQSNRRFLPEEKIQIGVYLENFLKQWAAHGAELKSAYTLEYDQFIVIAVDESFNAASGCSIDASVGVIRTIEQEFDVSLLDRTNVAVLHEGEIATYPFNQIKQHVADGKILPDDTVFNNTVQTFGDWQANWQQKAKESWVSRFFN
ncbi:MAG: hypothetical protein ABJN36_08035 [Cyclobacteriaceae bacterium]